MINVFILTFCRDLEAFYGTELIFKTLRRGFPNANVHVFDNASLLEVRSEIKTLAKENDCNFKQFERKGVEHHQFIEDIVYSAGKDGTYPGPIVFLDPDICLWDTCEDFTFEGLIAGHLFGKFYDTLTRTITMPRLHTSFFWITDPKGLMSEIWKHRARHFDFEPFRPYSFNLEGTWYRYDTGASLYSVLPGQVSLFTEEHLNHFDHLFAGSHLDWLFEHYDEKSQEMFTKIHNYAKEGNLKALKGTWKYQKEIFSKDFTYTDRIGG